MALKAHKSLTRDCVHGDADAHKVGAVQVGVAAHAEPLGGALRQQPVPEARRVGEEVAARPRAGVAAAGRGHGEGEGAAGRFGGGHEALPDGWDRQVHLL